MKNTEDANVIFHDMMQSIKDEVEYANTFVECETVLLIKENKQYAILEILDIDTFVIGDLDGNTKIVSRNEVRKIRSLKDSGKTMLMSGAVRFLEEEKRKKIKIMEMDEYRKVMEKDRRK